MALLSFEEVMVRKNLIRMLQVVLVLAIAPAGVAAQESGAIDPSGLPAEARELIAELQQVQSEIEPIQQEALADPELQAEQAAIGEQIQMAMQESDPAVTQQMERLQTLMREAQAARAEEDEARMGQIVDEAMQIEEQLQAAQMEALQRPEIAPRVEGFQARLHEKMLEVDPATDALLQRLRELDLRLAAMMASGQ